jgi:hypothetical protein
MSDIKNMVRKVGGRFYTENLMSNPVQVRESVTMTVEQLNDFVKAIVDVCLEIAEPMPGSTDIDDRARGWICDQMKTEFGVL